MWVAGGSKVRRSQPTPPTRPEIYKRNLNGCPPKYLPIVALPRQTVGAHRRTNMATILRSPIEELVDRLFREIKAQAKRGELCQNPVTGGWFVWRLDPIAL